MKQDLYYADEAQTTSSVRNPYQVSFQQDVKLIELVQYGAQWVAMNLQVICPHWNYLDSTNNTPLHTETVCVVWCGRPNNTPVTAKKVYFIFQHKLRHSV